MRGGCNHKVCHPCGSSRVVKEMDWGMPYPPHAQNVLAQARLSIAERTAPRGTTPLPYRTCTDTASLLHSKHIVSQNCFTVGYYTISASSQLLHRYHTVTTSFPLQCRYRAIATHFTTPHCRIVPQSITQYVASPAAYPDT